MGMTMSQKILAAHAGPVSYTHLDVYKRQTEVIPNDKLNEVIALHGSSPAFLYLSAQQFIRYGVSAGLDEDVCLRLFAQSLAGSAKMLTDSGKTVDELIEMVSSKGGTTIAGLAALRENGIEKAVTECCQKCTARALSLIQIS